MGYELRLADLLASALVYSLNGNGNSCERPVGGIPGTPWSLVSWGGSVAEKTQGDLLKKKKSDAGI